MRASFVCRVFLKAGKNALGVRWARLQTSEGDPPVLRLTERSKFLNPHYFYVVKIPRLATHDTTRRVYLALLKDPTLSTVDDPLWSPFRD